MHAALQVCNAYGAGLTDWDMSSLYGKLCIFAFAAWGGGHGGVTAGLAICGVMLSVTSAAAGAQTSGRARPSPAAVLAALHNGSAIVPSRSSPARRCSHEHCKQQISLAWTIGGCRCMLKGHLGWLDIEAFCSAWETTSELLRCPGLPQVCWATSRRRG